VEITVESMAYGDSNDLRKFVGVGGDDGGLNLRVQLAAGLDGHRHLARSFDLPPPVIH
jgi:hypothetical protein